MKPFIANGLLNDSNISYKPHQSDKESLSSSFPSAIQTKNGDGSSRFATDERTNRRFVPDAVLNEENLPIRFGFRCGDRGVHGSRSIMFSDLTNLFDSTPVGATYEDYRVAIMEENVLGKETATTRLWSWKKLREIYGLDPGLAVFRCFRQLWYLDTKSHPLLAILCACARDPLLRKSASMVLDTPIYTIVTAQDFSSFINTAAPDRFSEETLKAIGSHLFSSWTQSGHLVGSKIRKRALPDVSPGAITYALVLGRLTGTRGPLLFSTFWTAILDTPKGALFELATKASQRGWIDFRHAGSIVDVGFSKLLTPEEEAFHE